MTGSIKAFFNLDSKNPAFLNKYFPIFANLEPIEIKPFQSFLNNNPKSGNTPNKEPDPEDPLSLTSLEISSCTFIFSSQVDINKRSNSSLFIKPLVDTKKSCSKAYCLGKLLEILGIILPVLKELNCFPKLSIPDLVLGKIFFLADFFIT